MNGLLILLLSAALLAAGYWLYGKRIEENWGVDIEALTPAIRRHDHTDYISTRSWLLMAEEFVTVCAVMVVFGPAAAARFGWLPVLIWILLGGVFIGGVQEYSALYASVKNRGLTLAGLLERFAGPRWKRVFLVFTWLVCVVAIAAFADIAARLLDGYIEQAVVNELNELGNTDPVPGRAGTVILLLYAFAVLVGLAGYYSKIKPWAARLITVTTLICSFMLGLLFPVGLRPSLWHIIILSFALLSAAGPVWLTLQPRGQLHTYLYGGLLLLVLLGIVFGPRPTALTAVTGFSVGGETLFPWLFVILTWGAVSGLQALTASGVISRQIRGEGRMLRVSFGAVMLECFVAVLALVCVARLDAGTIAAAEEPGALFLSAVGGVLAGLGIAEDVSQTLYILLLAGMCIGALETIARAARVSWQEFFDLGKLDEDGEPSMMQLALSNGWIGAGVTLLAALALARIGCDALWPLFGPACQAVSALALMICAVWLRSTGRRSVWVWAPMILMLLVSFTALILALIEAIASIMSGSGALIVELVRIVLSLAIFAVTALLSFQGIRALLQAEPEQQ